MPPQGNPLFSLIGPLVIFMIFYFLLIMPQRKEQKKRQDMLSKISKNDEIVTSGGIHGTVVNVKETTVILRIDENVKVELDKTAVAYMVKKTA